MVGMTEKKEVGFWYLDGAEVVCKSRNFVDVIGTARR
jgi:hypothetical protein